MASIWRNTASSWEKSAWLGRVLASRMMRLMLSIFLCQSGSLRMSGEASSDSWEPAWVSFSRLARHSSNRRSVGSALGWQQASNHWI